LPWQNRLWPGAEKMPDARTPTVQRSNNAYTRPTSYSGRARSVLHETGPSPLGLLARLSRWAHHTSTGSLFPCGLPNDTDRQGAVNEA
jgi:hypothetical protein